MSTLPRFAHLLSNAPPALPSQSRAQLYRSYLQHIRLLPDPHLWSVLIPQFRKGCLQLPPQLDIASPSDARKQRPAKGSEWTAEKKVEALRVSRMERRVKKLRKVGSSPASWIKLKERET